MRVGLYEKIPTSYKIKEKDVIDYKNNVSKNNITKFFNTIPPEFADKIKEDKKLMKLLMIPARKVIEFIFIRSDDEIYGAIIKIENESKSS